MKPALAVFAFVTACSGSHASSGSAGASPEIRAPRPLGPPSLSFSTSRVPSFRWEPAPGTDGARIEICHDRACDRILASFDARGSAAAPPTELPSGLVFWRLRGTSGGNVGSETSVPWELTIPGQSAPVATTWGTLLDANGDGFGDVVAGDTNGFQLSKHVYVFLGGPRGPSAAPSSVLSGQSATVHYAESVAAAGDVDGDGYGDLAVGSPSEDTVYFYRGGPAGYADPPSLVLTGPGRSRFGEAVSAAGDVDGDGYADLLVGLPIRAPSGGSRAVGGARVYFGSASGLSTSAFVELMPPATSDEQGFGQFVTSAGDLNGDGRGDLAVYGGVGSFDPQNLYVYLGGSRSLGASPDLTLEYDGTDYSWLDAAAVLSCAGDLDGDGYADLAMATPPLGETYDIDHVSLFYGGPSLSPVPSRRIDSPLAYGDHFGLSVAAGDFDHDGVDDLAVGALCFDALPPAALVYAGGGNVPSFQKSVTTRDRAWQAVREVGAADVDGDGFPDLLIGYPGRVTPSSARAADGGTTTLHGAVEIHRGGPSGVAAAPSWTLLPPDGSAMAFGASLARP